MPREAGVSRDSATLLLELAHSPLDLPVTDACSWHPSLRGGADGGLRPASTFPKGPPWPRSRVGGWRCRDRHGSGLSTVGTGLKAGTAACGHGGRRRADSASLRCKWRNCSWSGERPPRATRSIFLSLGRICTPTIPEGFRKNDFLPDETQPPLAPGWAPDVCSVLLGCLGRAGGVHAFVSTPQKRGTARSDTSTLKSQGNQSPHTCLPLRVTGVPGPTITEDL